MGTVSQIHGRTRAPAHRIESDEEALASATCLKAFLASGARGRNAGCFPAYAEMDRLFQSGLGAIAIPSEYDGLDIPNMVLAQIVVLIAEGDPSVGECLAAHFHALEALRSHEGTEVKDMLYRRVIHGDRFAHLVLDAPALSGSTTEATGLSGRALAAPGLLYADWLAVSSEDGTSTAYVARNSPGIQILDDEEATEPLTNGAGVAIFDRAPLAGFAALRNGATASGTTKAIDVLLQAAVDLGIANAALNEYHRLGGASADFALFGLRLEAVFGALETAGRKLDAAEISSGDAAIRPAIFAAHAVALAAGAAAADITGAISRLPSPNISNPAADLSCNWRQLRIRGGVTAKDALLRDAAAYYGSSRGVGTDA